MPARARRIALLGGTFDPIHRGHLAAAHAVLASGGMDEVRFVVAGDPPHKPAGPRMPAEQRWLMAVLATLDEPRMRVERWEIDRPGKSYAVDTVKQAHEALRRPGEPPPEIHWAIGTDAMALIDTWHEVRELFNLTRFLVIARSGFDETALRAHLAETVPWAPPAAVTFIAMPPVDLSSTALREALRSGARVDDALPPAVATYVSRYALYREPVDAAGGLR